MTIELLQFRFSPYNEKARWALDLKGVRHSRRSLLPGPHMAVVRRLTGQTATPVLIIDGVATAGSAAILELIERKWPEPPLMPSEKGAREEAIAIERRFDEGWTPRARRALLDAMLTDTGYVARSFGGGFLYRVTLPLASRMIRKGNGIDGPEAVADGMRGIDEMLDFVATRCARTGYLVGDVFSIADVTAASTLATLCSPDHPDMRRPDPMPHALTALLARYAKHPAIAWTRHVYQKHRPQPLAD